jgi:hypothetical protein
VEYRDFGNTGVKISRLGFGTMRLPMVEVGGKNVVDEDLSTQLLHRAFELGVNYVDTAWFYCEHLSENAVGKALKGWRDKVVLSTKYPFNQELRLTLEEQLRKLDTDYIDFYHFHGIGESVFEHEHYRTAVEQIVKAKEEGLIRHISFSFHDKPEVMDKIIDVGIFETVLCQYNIMDRGNEEAMERARARGLGVVVMGPVGGGRVAGLPPELSKQLGIEVKSSAELALRFVFANPNVDCAISGMSTLEMVEQNVATASNVAPLSAEEVAGINGAMIENKKLSDLYCTGCNYCLPHCPNEVNISRAFQAMNYLRVYGLGDFARQHYDAIGSEWVKGAKADACIQCGECEQHCPQGINIRQQLEEVQAAFGG